MFVNYFHCSVSNMATCIDLTNELSSTIEKTNHARLWRLITDGGNKVLKQIFDSIIPPSSLASCLAQQKNKNTLWYLHRVKHVISNQEWRVLYPGNSGAVTSDDFDVTLLMILFRNICKLRQPPTGWDNQPTPHDYSLEADIVRVKLYRNKIAHCVTTNIDKEVFEQWWFEMNEALVRLGADRKDIDQLKTENMDRETEEMYLEEMTEFSRTSLLANDLVTCLLDKFTNPDPDCREHGSEFELYCTTCRKLICEICKGTGKHDSHEQNLVKEEALAMYNKLKTFARNLQDKKRDIEKFIEKAMACAESLERQYNYQERRFNRSVVDGVDMQANECMAKLREQYCRMKRDIDEEVKSLQDKEKSIRHCLALIKNVMKMKTDVRLVSEGHTATSHAENVLALTCTFHSNYDLLCRNKSEGSNDVIFPALAPMSSLTCETPVELRSVRERLCFTIDAKSYNNDNVQNCTSELRVVLYDARGNVSDLRVARPSENNATHSIHFVPWACGDYQLSVRLRGHNIKNSPFRFKIPNSFTCMDHINVFAAYCFFSIPTSEYFLPHKYWTVFLFNAYCSWCASPFVGLCKLSLDALCDPIIDRHHLAIKLWNAWYGYSQLYVFKYILKEAWISIMSRK